MATSYERGTDPTLAPDSDRDGVPDRRETNSRGDLDPLNPDSDGDTLTDGEELAIGTDPTFALRRPVRHDRATG